VSREDQDIADRVADMGRAIMQTIDERVDVRTEDGFADASSGLIAAHIAIVYQLAGDNEAAAVAFATMAAEGIANAFLQGNAAGIAADMKRRN